MLTTFLGIWTVTGQVGLMCSVSSLSHVFLLLYSFLNLYCRLFKADKVNSILIKDYFLHEENSYQLIIKVIHTLK